MIIMATKKNLQLPLLQDKTGVIINITLDAITPIAALDCQEPDSELIESIAQYWVPPILVCPDNRYPGKYYPIDGKRRVKAVAYLADIGFEFNNKPVNQVPIQAVFRDDLLPQDEASYRIAFQANNLRSSNPSTDVNAIKSTAQSLGVDVFTKEGRSAVAKALRSNPATIAKLAKGIFLAESIMGAYQKEQISRETYIAIAEMKDIQARAEVTKRLEAGEELSKADVLAYNKQSKQIELTNLATSRPQAETQTAELNPLTEAIEYLEVALETINEPEAIPVRKAYELLKKLL